MKTDKLHALEISLTIGCRLDCLYCPQKLLLTTLVGMTSEDFEKIKDIQFDSFVLHIPDAENHSKFKDDCIDLLCRKCAMAKKVSELPVMQLKNAVENHVNLSEYFPENNEIVVKGGKK